MAKWDWRLLDWLNSVRRCIFTTSLLSLPWKMVELFIWINLNPLHPRMFCVKFGWNWPSGSREEDFKNFVNVFLLFHYFPFEKRLVLHLCKLESPSPKDALWQVCLKFPEWFLRRRKCEKLTTMMTTMMMDNRQIVIRKAHLNLRVRWDKKQSKFNFFKGCFYANLTKYPFRWFSLYFVVVIFFYIINCLWNFWTNFWFHQ